jgi:hypothetical protein
MHLIKIGVQFHRIETLGDRDRSQDQEREKIPPKIPH